MTNIDDFKKEDGKTDWTAYTQAEIDCGERCFNCNSYIGLFSNGVQRMCYDCQGIEKSEEFNHDKLIRCPYCGETEDVGDENNYELYKDGEHGVMCSSCGKDYSVSTEISYSFASPELNSHAQSINGGDNANSKMV